MQGPTHLIMGIAIQKSMAKVRRLPLQYFLVIFSAIVSHGILDRFARLTYHPPTPLTGDWFWTSYHLIIAFLTILIFVKYWGKYKLGLIFSVIPDLDWVVLHSANLLSVEIPLWKGPVLHQFFFSFMVSTPPFRFLNYLPDWSLERGAAIVELVLLIVLARLTYGIGRENGEKLALTTKRRKVSSWKYKLTVYLACMDHEEKIRTSYQSLLTSLEIAMLGFTYYLYQLNMINLIWLLPTAGTALCIFFGVACEFRARNVDYWRVQIFELVRGTDLEERFKEAKYEWIPFGKAGFFRRHFGHWFERILVSGLLILWQSSLCVFTSPLIIRWLGILATLGWLTYVFDVVKLKGKIINT